MRMPPFATVWAMGSDMLRGSASGTTVKLS
jgi:hypothetical protein